MKESYSIQSVSHALDLLEVLCEEGDGVQISQLSVRLGMNKSSIFRLLATLEARGYVQRDEGSRRYRLGITAYEMAQRFLSHMSLLRKARPVMERLARQSDEAVYLAIRRDADVLLLDMFDTGQQVKIAPLVGKRFPLAAMSAGRVVLAFASAECGLHEYWVREVRRDVLENVRREGCAFDVGGVSEDVACLAVPILNGRGDVEASLALIGPEFRMAEAGRRRELFAQLHDAAGVISSGMGCFVYFERAKLWSEASRQLSAGNKVKFEMVADDAQEGSCTL